MQTTNNSEHETVMCDDQCRCRAMDYTDNTIDYTDNTIDYTDNTIDYADNQQQ